MSIAFSNLYPAYSAVWEVRLGSHSIAHCINDGLMAFFLTNWTRTGRGTICRRALDVILKDYPALVFVGFKMPMMNVIEVLQAIKGRIARKPLL